MASSSFVANCTRIGRAASRGHGAGPDLGEQGLATGEPKRSRLPSASMCDASHTPNPGSKRSRRLPHARRSPLGVQRVGVVDGEVGGARRARLGAGSRPGTCGSRRHVAEVDVHGVARHGAVAAAVDVHGEAQGLVVGPHGIEVGGRKDRGDALEGGHARRTLPWSDAPPALDPRAGRPRRSPCSPWCVPSCSTGPPPRAARRRAGHRQPRHLAGGPAQATRTEARRVGIGRRVRSRVPRSDAAADVVAAVGQAGPRSATASARARRRRSLRA